MKTIPQIVRRELEAEPLLLEFLTQGLGNISAVAKRLLPLFEAELQQKVKLSAVSMAIRRYLDEEQQRGAADWMFPANLEITSKSNIYEVAFKRSKRASAICDRIRQSVNISSGDFLSIVEGTYEVVVFTNQKHKSEVRKTLSRSKISSELDNLAYVTVNWERVTKDIPGIYYRITRSLALKGLSIQSFHTIGAEMVLFFKEDAFPEAHRTLIELLRC